VRSSRALADVCSRGALALLLALCAACRDDNPAQDDPEPDAGPPPAFPADFAEHYLEMRDCRFSHEHDLRSIRVLASETAQDSYARLTPDAPYPPGATLVKLEYDDELCTELLGYTVMHKLAPGENPAGYDWLWQRVGPDRQVLEQGATWTCVNCHTYHCAPPYGYDLTCAEEAGEF
jgi:hypothetical protein